MYRYDLTAHPQVSFVHHRKRENKLEMIIMKNKWLRLTALSAALVMSASMGGCGKEVTNDETSGSFSIAGGTAAGDAEGTSQESITSSVDATQGQTNDPAVTTSVSGDNGFSAVTRSAEELEGIIGNNGSHGGNGGSQGGNNGSQGGNGTSQGGNGGSQGGNNGSQGGNGGTSAPTGITLSYYSAEVIVGQTIQYPVVSETISEVWTSSDNSIATVDAAGNITGVSEGNCVIRVVSAENSSIGAEVKVTVTSSNGIQKVDDVTYVDGILIANKTYALPDSYNPGGLTSETSQAFAELAAGAANDGLSIYVSSGFRSYWDQDYIYNNYVAQSGQATADTFSARPGHSEHQTGLAIDVNEISDAFIGTPEAIWLEEHCTEYGFIIRYPKGKQQITGYKYEPWHIRYVGKTVAQQFKDAAAAAGDPYLTLEEYLGIDSYYH